MPMNDIAMNGYQRMNETTCRVFVNLFKNLFSSVIGLSSQIVIVYNFFIESSSIIFLPSFFCPP